jgi:hypothetical protein
MLTYDDVAKYTSSLYDHVITYAFFYIQDNLASMSLSTFLVFPFTPTFAVTVTHIRFV